MVSSLHAALASYRQAAADLYNSRELAPSTSVKNGNTCSENRILEPYLRKSFPSLEQYLKQASERYANRVSTSPRIKHRKSHKLGEGTPVQNLSAEIRRERWQLARVREAHFANAIRITKLVDLVSACGIPKDVREMAAKAFLEFQLLKRRRTCQPTPPIERALGCTLGCANSEDIGLTDAATRPKGYHTHVARCRASIASGGNALQPGRKEYEGTLKVDTFEDVKRIYSGKPDELYRRKTARKFATWRRKHREAEKERVYQELQAENVMKKRRGYDQILTSRTSGDASFAPFLFDLNNQTYAFSSKITEAPKLRKIMVDKYSAETSSSDGHVLNNWQKAHQAAENNPLFHTKVMNRFA